MSASSFPVGAAFGVSHRSSLYTWPISNGSCFELAQEMTIYRIRQLIICMDYFSPGRNVSLKELHNPFLPEQICKHPVITNCGHVYDGTDIQRRVDVMAACLFCNVRITSLFPVHELRKFVEHWRQKEPFTCPNFGHLNELSLAEHFEQPALTAGSSKDYAIISELYRNFGETEKRAWHDLYLSMYQLQEGEIRKAIDTLRFSGLNFSITNPLIVALRLQKSRSLENITWALSQASNQKIFDLKDRIFIYKQIIAIAPYELEAYKQLIPLINNPEERQELLLHAAGLAREAGQFDLEGTFCRDAGISSVAISSKEWGGTETMNLPPYSQELKDFLAGDCDHWPEKKRWQTHVVFPMPSEVVIDESRMSFTLDSLDQLDKSVGGTGFRSCLGKIPKNIPAKKGFYWGVLTKDELPGSQWATESDFELPPGYEKPGVLDVAAAFLWRNRASVAWCFGTCDEDGNQSMRYILCKEVFEDGSVVVVGDFNHKGLDINICRHRGEDPVHVRYWDVAIAGFRKFRA